MKNITKYLLASGIAIAICVIVIALSWNRPPAYQPFPQGSATLDFPNTAAGTSSDLTITVSVASDGDPIMLAVPNGSTVSNGLFTAWVSATNTVTVRFYNNSLLTAFNPASGVFMAMVCKH